MITVHHPHMADVSYEVPESRLADWVAAGWVAEAAPLAPPITEAVETPDASDEYDESSSD